MTESNQICSRCSEAIEKPVRKSANYVIHTEFSEEQEMEVTYGMFHSDETRAELDRVDNELTDRGRQALAAEMAHPDADEHIEIPDGEKTVQREGGEVTTADTKEIKFSVPVELFDHREIESPNQIQDDDELALTYTNVEPREVQKTAVVCPACTLTDDEIIWGVDN
jgi:hypothetical protein